MPPAIRGSVHWYHFGPLVGSELSGSRPALIISNTDLNRGLPVAIALPMSTSTPSARHLHNHVFIEAAGSWASVRQIKTIDRERLGDKIAEASAIELERVVEILVERMASSSFADSGQIESGTLLDLAFHDESDSPQTMRVLVLDYNRANGIAIVAEVENREAPTSPVRKPVRIVGSSQPASALVHRVRSFDLQARTVHSIGTIDDASLTLVGKTLLSILDA